MQPDTELMDMLRFKRPAFSSTEESFISLYLEPLPGFTRDEFGNIIIRVGDSPNIMWSSHTDTVHSTEGFQRLERDGPFIKAVCGAKREFSNCLGADCTAGVWIMMNMIRKSIPGLYIFHRDEESGGRGSSFIAKSTPEVVDGIQFAIAFDRKGYTSVITHQGPRTCSDEFALSLAEILGKGFKPDDTGLFTDTAQYTDLIPECTNVSVGYFNQHGPTEKQNWLFVQHLLDVVLAADFDGLIPFREAGEVDDDYIDQYSRLFASAGTDQPSTNNVRNLDDFIYYHATDTVLFLEKYGITLEVMQEFRAKRLEDIFHAREGT